MKITIIEYDVYDNKYNDEQIAILKSAAPNIIVDCLSSECVSKETLYDSDVIFGWPPSELLVDLPNLKWLHLPSAGSDSYNKASVFSNPDIIVTKSSGTFGIPISESIIGMMITLSRNFLPYYDNQKKNSWTQIRAEYPDIFNSTVFVLGLGNIGTELCKRLSGFDCNIIGFRNNPSTPCEYADEVLPVSEFRNRLPEADFIAICLPGTSETKNLISFDEFKLMKSSAIIANIGRGSIINTDALIDALNTNKIGGAGLDVTDPEPLPPDHPLWKAKNVLITPHVSAASRHNKIRRLMIFADLIKRYQNGQPLYNIVDFNKGY